MPVFRKLSALIAAIAFLCLATAASAATKHYLIANDDVPPKSPTGATFYTVAKDGSLTLADRVLTGGEGIAAGLFGTQRVVVLQSGKLQCAFLSMATTGAVVGIPMGSLKPGHAVRGSNTDDGTVGGIGLAVNANYLYAGFTTSNTIGTFQVMPGCQLQFVGDVAVGGLQGGMVDGMALTGNLLVVTYGDGSIESFDVSSGMPVSNGDKQNSTGQKGNNWPAGVDITRDGHYAIFGDVATSAVVEVSDISSGQLTPTVVYHLGANLSSANVRLSPDQTLLYVSNTQGGEVSAAFFDATTGKLSKGCSSKPLKGYGTDWAYLGTILTAFNSGSGSVLYVAEYGAPSSIGIVRVQVNGGKCALQETQTSPTPEPNSPGLLSIGVYPTRPF